MKTNSKKKYSENDKFRESKKINFKKKYSENDKFRETMKTNSKKKYSENDKFRESKKINSKKKYSKNDKFRETMKTNSKKKYSKNDKFRESKKINSKKKYSENGEYRELIKRNLRTKYIQNEKYKEFKRLKMKKRYYQDTNFRQKQKDIMKAYSSTKYHVCAEYRKKMIKKAIKYSFKKCRSLTSKRVTKVKKFILRFRESCSEFPTYTCTVCHRLLFKQGVKRFNLAVFPKNKIENAKLCATGKYVHTCDSTCILNMSDKCEMKNTSLWN